MKKSKFGKGVVKEILVALAELFGALAIAFLILWWNTDKLLLHDKINRLFGTIFALLVYCGFLEITHRWIVPYLKWYYRKEDN